MKLRLLLFEHCNRSCDYCCNHQFDLTKIPVCESYAGYDEIVLTGGEPLLDPGLIRRTVRDIKRENPNALIWLYTARPFPFTEFFRALDLVDGVTLTLHKRSDTIMFRDLQFLLDRMQGVRNSKSLRLTAFEHVNIDNTDTTGWRLKRIKVLEECPIPEGEVFMRHRDWVPAKDPTTLVKIAKVEHPDDCNCSMCERPDR